MSTEKGGSRLHVFKDFFFYCNSTLWKKGGQPGKWGSRRRVPVDNSIVFENFIGVDLMVTTLVVTGF